MAPGTDTATDARQRELTEAAFTERALRLLARREHSRFELRRKLLRGRVLNGGDRGNAGGQMDVLVNSVLDDLARRDLLSDARFAEAFVRGGIDRGQGPLKIRAALRGRGVADDVIDDTLTFSDDFWLDRARAAQAKRFGNGSGPDGETDLEGNPTNRSEWAKRARFLAGRGFASDIIYRTVTKAP